MDFSTVNDSFATDFIQYYLRVMTSSPSPVLPLVFAEERNVLVNNIGYFRSIFKTFDTLDFDIHWSDLNISTAIELPIS
jgi:hypothetical protein